MKSSNNSLKVTIIILNWNGWKDTIECLESIYQIDYPNFNIIIIDNLSTDESILKIKEYCWGKIELKSDFFEYSKKNKPIDIIELSKEEIEHSSYNPEVKSSKQNRNIILIKNNKNYGFAEGNNIGIKYALKYLSPNYVLLLNNDTVVDKYFLNELIKVTDINDKISILGPTIYWYNHKTKIQSAGVKLYPKLGHQKILGLNKIDKGQFKDVSQVNYVSGCALLAKSEIFNKIGFLDIDYFLYWEEADWCFRASNAGYQIFHVPNAKIWHKGSVSSTSSNKIYYVTRNMFWFVKKNVKKTHYILFLFYFFFLRLWFQMGVYLIYHRTINGTYSFFKGIKNGINNH